MMIIILIMILILGQINSVAQGLQKDDKKGEKTDLSFLVSKYKTETASSLREKLSAKEMKVKTEKIVKNWPVSWKENVLKPTDAPQYSFVWNICRESERLTGKHYDLILIASETPFLASEESSLIIVSTGFIEVAKWNEDAILAAFLHEIAHELFDTEEMKVNYNLAIKEKRFEDAAFILKKLAVTEIECDIIAVIFLRSARKDYMAYEKLLFELEKRDRYSNQPRYHPPSEVRAKVINYLFNSVWNVEAPK